MNVRNLYCQALDARHSIYDFLICVTNFPYFLFSQTCLYIVNTNTGEEVVVLDQILTSVH